MEVIVHRGTHQIGGCATEYRTKRTRILVDFGAELDGTHGAPLDITGVTRGESRCDGVFFTHYHGDHMGLLDTINRDIPLYMGAASKQIATILNDRLRRAPGIPTYDGDRLAGIQTFEVGKSVLIGDIKITPYAVDHSAFDAYMFKIEGEGKTVLHTGDFRAHGFRGKGLKVTLENHVKTVDAIVCEGTTLNRGSAKAKSENELQRDIKKVLEENKYVFVVCPSTNIDRLAGVCAAVPRGKYCLCDDYQYEVLEYVRAQSGHRSPLYRFDKLLRYGKNLDGKMARQGFCMFVRLGNPRHKQIMEQYKDQNPTVIYSAWRGYLAEEENRDFLDGYRVVRLHTSGHADRAAIGTVIDTLRPKLIVPMHTEVPDEFLTVAGEAKVILAKDKETIDLEGI